MYNMDLMRISGTEPSSVLLRQMKQIWKLKLMFQMRQNKLKAKRMV